MFEEQQIREWREERDRAVYSFNVNKFKKFYNKWLKLGMYDMPLPSDDRVLEISMRKEVLMMKNPPRDKLEQAKAWLTARGFSTTDWRS